LHELLNTILLGIVEGVTEFLPVSSTGHLFLCTDPKVLGPLLSDEFTKLFNIFIQIGAIAAVVVYFRQKIVKLLQGRPIEAEHTPDASGVAEASSPGTNEVPPRSPYWPIWMIILATAPVLIVAKFTHKWTEAHLEKPLPIALALAIGGLLMIFIEMMPRRTDTQHMESISWPQALGIGLAQILAAVFPGTSRSAATIMAGLVGGLSRAAAAEFSFFLAIPAMSAACGYSLLKYFKEHPHVSTQEILLLVIGTLVSFLVAWGVIAVFMNYIRRRTFIPFGVYRILFSVVVYLFLVR
jgi:undecaprenyl-diphosphatase